MNRRLSDGHIRLILTSSLSARKLAYRFSLDGIRVTHSMISRIRAGTRYTEAHFPGLRRGTRYDTDPSTAPPDAFIFRRRQGKRYQRKPEYLSRTGRLRPGYELRELEVAAYDESTARVEKIAAEVTASEEQAIP